MEVRSIDPRDIEWEVDVVAFRVYFWDGTTSYEHEFTGANGVEEVIAWAEGNAEGRPYTLYAKVMNGESPGLVLLSGVDPTSKSS